MVHCKLPTLVCEFKPKEVTGSPQVTYVEVVLQNVLCGLHVCLIIPSHKNFIHVDIMNDNANLSPLDETMSSETHKKRPNVKIMMSNVVNHVRGLDPKIVWCKRHTFDESLKATYLEVCSMKTYSSSLP